MVDLGFLVVGDDPELPRHQIEQLRTRRDVLSEAHRDLADLAASRRLDQGVGEIDFSQAQGRFGQRDLGLEPALGDAGGLEAFLGDLDRGFRALDIGGGRARGGAHLVALANRN